MTVMPAEQPDYPVLPPLLPTERQMSYARKIASAAGIRVPGEARRDRTSLSRWIDANRHRLAQRQAVDASRPTSRQVAWAERIARGRRREIPQECYRSRQMLARWIDANAW